MKEKTGEQKKKKNGIFKKLHRWPGLIISFILLYYGITGTFMNHRELFSGVDLRRTVMPEEYEYRNWNNAAVKGNLVINRDSILIYGNIGVWVTDSTFTIYRSLNNGFPRGTDNRKVADIHRCNNGGLYAATLFGLYAFDNSDGSWKIISAEKGDNRFTAVDSRGDTLYALSRSYLYTGFSAGVSTRLNRIQLPAPEGFRNEVGLFETVWQIHSGEIFGLPGKVFVDMLGVLTVFLSLTGMVYFFFPGWIVRRTKKTKSVGRISSINKWSLKWHNKFGAWFFIFLIILYFTGIFLRPPLLLAIASSKVRPVIYSNLDRPNPWHDKFRDLLYDREKELFLLSTSEGMYFFSDTGKRPSLFAVQPPVSVMGINAFEPIGNGAYIVGSFTGLFLWQPSDPEIYNFITGEKYVEVFGRPVGDFKISGVVTDGSGRKYISDYDLGLLPLGHNGIFPEMPDNIREESKISLWSVSLEIHTGRIFNSLLGGFYILVVPLAGLTGITVVISGYMVWRRKYRKQPDEVIKYE
jgi:hypothetical protein